MKKSLILIFLIFFIFPNIVFANKWDISTVDREGGVGLNSKLVLDESGYPHIVYYDSTNWLIKYAYFDGKNWTTQKVGVGYDGWYDSIAVDKNNNAYIVFYDGTFTNGRLRYAKYNGSWYVETLKSGISGWYDYFDHANILVDKSNNPHIFYAIKNSSLIPNTSKYELTYYSHWTNTGWNTTILPLPPDVYNQGSSVVMGEEEKFHIVSRNFKQGEGNYLSYEVWNGTHLTDEKVEDLSGPVLVSIALNKGVPHISYSVNEKLKLKYAVKTGTSWSVEVVDTGDILFNSIAVDMNGIPHIAYYDSSIHKLKHAYKEINGWVIETVPDNNQVGEYVSLAIDKNNNLHIAYYDVGNFDLKYARTISEHLYNISISGLRNSNVYLYNSSEILINYTLLSYFANFTGITNGLYKVIFNSTIPPTGVLNTDSYYWNNENVTTITNINNENVNLEVKYFPTDITIVNTTSKITSVEWNPSTNNFKVNIDCIDNTTIQYFSLNKPAQIKVNGMIIDYTEVLSSIPSWKYDSINKIITVKFSC